MQNIKKALEKQLEKQFVIYLTICYTVFYTINVFILRTGKDCTEEGASHGNGILERQDRL